MKNARLKPKLISTDSGKKIQGKNIREGLFALPPAHLSNSDSCRSSSNFTVELEMSMKVKNQRETLKKPLMKRINIVMQKGLHVVKSKNKTKKVYCGGIYL